MNSDDLIQERLSREDKKNISDKIAVLRREGKSEKQAVAIAYSMARAGRLKPGGKYILA